jgi:hypothetical protein
MVNPVVCFLATCLLAAQADAPASDVPATVRKLVRQLDAPEKARRDEAEQKLLEVGSAALDALPAPTDASAEVQLRLGRVRVRLETLRGEEEVRSREVTIAGKALPLPEVIAAIDKQTGNKLLDYRGQFGQQAAAKTLDLELEKTPFWSALDQILDQAGMTIYQYSGEPGLSLVNRSGGEVPRYNRGVYAGAFRIEATDITARRDLRDANGQALKLQLDVAWEPRLVPIAITQAGDAITAIGDTGGTLAAAPNTELESTVNPGEASVQVPLTFSLPPRAMTKIASLKGNLDVILPGPIETFRFEKLKAGAKAEERRAGVKVILDQVRQNNLVWEVRVRVAFDNPGKALESHRTWVLHNEAYLETAAKDKINSAGMETTRQSENEVGVAYLFDVEEITDHTFVYKTPAVLLDVAVPYELHDIALP